MLRQFGKAMLLVSARRRMAWRFMSLPLEWAVSKRATFSRFMSATNTSHGIGEAVRGHSARQIANPAHTGQHTTACRGEDRRASKWQHHHCRLFACPLPSTAESSGKDKTYERLDKVLTVGSFVSVAVHLRIIQQEHVRHELFKKLLSS